MSTFHLLECLVCNVRVCTYSKYGFFFYSWKSFFYKIIYYYIYLLLLLGRHVPRKKNLQVLASYNDLRVYSTVSKLLVNKFRST